MGNSGVTRHIPSLVANDHPNEIYGPTRLKMMKVPMRPSDSINDTSDKVEVFCWCVFVRECCVDPWGQYSSRRPKIRPRACLSVSLQQGLPFSDGAILKKRMDGGIEGKKRYRGRIIEKKGESSVYDT